MSKYKKILVFDFFDIQSSQHILEGVRDFMEQTSPEWMVTPAELNNFAPTLIDRIRPDGILAHMPSNAGHRKNLDRLLQHVAPTVAMLERPNDSFPLVAIDDYSTGALAARTLLENGHRKLAILCREDSTASIDRRNGFMDVADQHGIPCDCYAFAQEFISTVYADDSEKGLGAWLRRLDKPVGIFTSNDSFAYHLCLLCRELDIAIPEDAAVLGANNDIVSCNLFRPNLSSINLPFRQIGYSAAATLSKLFDGKPVGSEPLRFPPEFVVNRQSTDHLQLDDPLVKQAVLFIRKHPDKPLIVKDLLSHFNISRSALEKRFRKLLGRTPLDEIRRQKIALARQLLADTRLSMEQISEQCGFSSAIRFSQVFRSVTGEPPSAYRRKMTQSSLPDNNKNSA